ncbi:MAG: hypothetical protein JWM68_1471 [Verrucomicrobiales bacterium]|nr:hypothetical protein [Verrucomicrobiales bacterium]
MKQFRIEQSVLNLTTVLALLFAATPVKVFAQYNQKSAADIIREGQERQRAIEQAAAEFRQKANEILEQQRQKQKEEREEREARRKEEQQEREQRTQDERREREEQRRAEAEEKQKAEFQKQIKETLPQQQENAQRQQEQIGQTLRGKTSDATTDSTANPSFTQSPPPVVKTGSITDTYRQAANRYRWAAKEYRAKGENEKANEALDEAAKYDKMAEELDSNGRPVVIDVKPTPPIVAPGAGPLTTPKPNQHENRCGKCGALQPRMSARTTCIRCGQ